MYEYFLHTTLNILEILQSGYLDESYSDEYEVEQGMEPGIYCHYLWDGLPQIYKDMEWIYYGKHRYIIIMDKDITKTNKMYICKSVQHGTCVKHKDEQIKINSKTLNFKPLQNHIMKQIDAELNRTIQNRDTQVYLFSHEVIFKGKIPISHIKAILINKNKKDIKHSKKIIKFIDDHHLPIKIIPFAPYTSDFQKYFKII